MAKGMKAHEQLRGRDDNGCRVKGIIDNKLYISSLKFPMQGAHYGLCLALQIYAYMQRLRIARATLLAHTCD